MALPRDYQVHKEYIDAIKAFDVDGIIKNEKSLENFQIQFMSATKQLGDMKILVDRSEIFNSTLQFLLQQNAITEAEKLSMQKYFEIVINNKDKLTSAAFVPNNVIFKIENRSLHMPDLQNNNVWDAVRKASAEIDETEKKLTLLSLEQDPKKRDAYHALSEQISHCNKEISNSQEKQDEDQERIMEIFTAENIADGNTLTTLCAQHNNHNEILLVEDGVLIDSDLAAVIQLRAKKNAEKGTGFIVMSFNNYNKIINQGHMVNGVTKLSFLHHGVREFGYVDEINNYILHMPNLTEIVIRGCGTANAPTENKDILREVKMSPVPYDKRPSVQGTNLAIQQKLEDGIVYSKVTWMSDSQPRVMKEIKDISSLPKIDSKKIDDEQLQKLARIDGMPLLKFSNAHINSMRKIFFNNDQAITSVEVDNSKHVLRRARTQTIEASSDDLLSRVTNNMTQDQKEKISVKAYVGGYHVEQSRVMPINEHDQSKQPKALRIGSKHKHSNSDNITNKINTSEITQNIMSLTSKIDRLLGIHPENSQASKINHSNEQEKKQPSQAANPPAQASSASQYNQKNSIVTDEKSQPEPEQTSVNIKPKF